MKPIVRLAAFLLLGLGRCVLADDPWLGFPAGNGPGEGRHIVLISGDEEYRSEEAMPMLGRLLSQRHGFRCTVLFAIDPATGAIDPNTTDNIPGLETLEDADLMVVFTRFRDLPDTQMRFVDAYLEAGKPVIGIRPSVVAFRPPRESRFFKYSSDNNGPEYAGGFGQHVLGATWISHHGRHGAESTRGLPVEALAGHQILHGVGPMWGPTDVYTVRTPIPSDGEVLVMGEVLQGMDPTDPPSDKPRMPLAWTRSYRTATGTARVFTTTMGASQDFLDENFRRLVVNACYWATGIEERISPRSNVDFVGAYEPTPFGFDGFRKGLVPDGLADGIPPAAATNVIRQVADSRWMARAGAMGASWRFDANGLRPGIWRDLRTGRQRIVEGEAFEISLADGSRYPASAMLIEREPKVVSLAADPQAARQAARLGGQALEAGLRSRDGRLRIGWRVVTTEQSDHLRQELAIQATEPDCVIDEIRWLDTKWPDAAQPGTVDGSPLVAGPFFFGCEDPMARNEIVRTNRVVGEWAPFDPGATRRTSRAWWLPAEAVTRGEVRIEFRYDHGPHRLDIWRVALRANGQEIAADEHHGHTGTSASANTYRLSVPAMDRETDFELIAVVGTDPGFGLPPGRRVESWGEVRLSAPTGRVTCRLPRRAPLGQCETLATSFVVGTAPQGQLRRAFLRYLEQERAHPYRTFLHYNSWYDTAWQPFALNEMNCLEAIELIGKRLVRRHGVVIDAMVFDDGWDDPRTLWRFHSGFPQGFTPLAERCREYGTQLGVWLSPFGGYGEPKARRLEFGRAQGFEINATGFSMAGPEYYANFKRACVEMIERYGVNHFKFDGIAAGMYADGGADYVRDTEAMRRLMLELREVAPAVYINFTTGSWPSPFWLRFADSLWRQGGDMGLAGKGPRQQQWLTYRDQEVYRNVVRKGPLFPLNSLMTQGVAYSRQGSAGDPTFDSAGFKDDVRAFFGGGTGLQELYIQPGRLTDVDWAVLAEAAKWSRANADVLIDTHWIGGDPGNLAVYGYASWRPGKGILMLRNPDDAPHAFALDVGAAFELPAGAAARYRLRSPWAEEAGEPALETRAGEPLAVSLQPFEVWVREATAIR
ncbi:MAG: ThuA domain-containing protein [Verrucomicrobiales bacterium]|nr:ThuA domain-containing protein [Verrucomicrobiales bacterium]